MQTIYVEIGTSGAMLHFASERRSGVAITLPDGVWVTTMPVPPATGTPTPPASRASAAAASFPPRDLTEAAILQVLRERGGTVKIRQEDWNIYDELAARLGVSFELRSASPLVLVSRHGDRKSDLRARIWSSEAYSARRPSVVAGSGNSRRNRSQDATLNSIGGLCY